MQEGFLPNAHAKCISGFPAFAENDGKGNGYDERGAYPAPSSTSRVPFYLLFFVFQERLGREAQEVLSGSTM